MIHAKSQILKIGTGFIAGGALFALSITSIFAHVVVKPDTVGIASYQTYTVGVPNEKEVPVTGLRLIIPEGLQSVTPNVKQGWTITLKKEESGEDSKVTEISWTGGAIPPGQRDDFLFSAKAPVQETTLQWKAYQTYKDGTIVSWDQAPVTNQTDEEREEAEKKGLGPYSQTKIVNDLASKTQTNTNEDALMQQANRANKAIFFSAIAILLGGASMWMQMKRKA